MKLVNMLKNNPLTIALILIAVAIAFNQTNAPQLTPLMVVFMTVGLFFAVWIWSYADMKKLQKQEAEHVKNRPTSYKRSPTPPSTTTNSPANAGAVVMNDALSLGDDSKVGDDLALASGQSGFVARGFASIEDAINLGWEFKDHIGSIGQQKIYKLATFKGGLWEFDGLSHELHPAIIPENIRLFGRLQYQEKKD